MWYQQAPVCHQGYKYRPVVSSFRLVRVCGRTEERDSAQCVCLISLLTFVCYHCASRVARPTRGCQHCVAGASVHTHSGDHPKEAQFTRLAKCEEKLSGLNSPLGSNSRLTSYNNSTNSRVVFI